jgi:hypothetical protein
MAQRGDINPQASLRDIFKKFGVDVDAPNGVQIFMQMFRKQTQNAMPMNKMSQIAGQGGPGGPPPGGMPPGGGAPPPQGGGMRDLLTKLGG